MEEPSLDKLHPEVSTPITDELFSAPASGPPVWYHGVSHKKNLKRVGQLLAMGATERWRHLYSEEALINATEKDYDKLLLEVYGDKEKYAELLEPIMETKYRYLATPDDLVPDEYTFKVARHIQERSLMDIMGHTIRHAEYTSHFTTDDKTKELVGFVSYLEDEPTNTVLGIKVFRFDDGDVTKDLLPLANELVGTHRAVHWDAIAENKATKAYHIYLLRKKREKFVTEERNYSVPVKNAGGGVTVIRATHYVVARKGA
jgi:hypothetical protein